MVPNFTEINGNREENLFRCLGRSFLVTLEESVFSKVTEVEERV